MTHLACPKCSAVIEVADNLAHSAQRCPGCGTAFRMHGPLERLWEVFVIVFLIVPAALAVLAVLALVLFRG